MAADKRDFSDFSKFPGVIAQTNAAKGWYLFPSVKSIDMLDRRRTWQITVRLIHAKDNKLPKKRVINWDASVGDVVVPITSAMLRGGEVPINTIAQIWTDQGIDNKACKKGEPQPYKNTRSIPTYVVKGKNLKKKNATNVLTQALIVARSKYLKKAGESLSRKNTKRVFPMAVHKYDDKPSAIAKRLVYPLAVQRKLDGGRIVAYYDDEKKTTVFYSRRLKDVIVHPDIHAAVDKLYTIINKRFPGMYLDGEIYKHGLALQQISGIMRRGTDSKTTAREEKTKKKTITLQYHIFDLFFPHSDSMRNIPYIERIVIMEQIFKQALAKHPDIFKYIVKVQTQIVDTPAAHDIIYARFLKQKYEGSIVRNLHAPYEFGASKEIRTYHARKRKPRYSDEFKIVDYTQGTSGKGRGAIIWVLTTAVNKKKGWEPVIFTTTMNMTYDEQYKLFNDMTKKNFNEKYKNKMMTVEHDGLSEDGVPVRQKAIGVRNFD
jgi:ATP-dependent DNA ligase